MKMNYYRLKQNELGMPYLEKQMDTYSVDKRTCFDNTEKIFKFCKANGLCDLAEEHVFGMYCNSNLNLIALSEISHGTINTSMFGIREIIQRALLFGSPELILIHNHPSGNLNPSQKDIAVTKKIDTACQAMGLSLAAHVILGKTKCRKI